MYCRWAGSAKQPIKKSTSELPISSTTSSRCCCRFFLLLLLCFVLLLLCPCCCTVLPQVPLLNDTLTITSVGNADYSAPPKWKGLSFRAII